MGLFDFTKKRKIKKQQNDNIKFLYSLNEKKLAYVTKRDKNGETILCKDAYFSILAKDLIIMSDNKIVFRSELCNIIPGELLSRNGVTLCVTENDIKTTYVAYYLYYRK